MIVGGVLWYCRRDEALDVFEFVVEARTSRTLVKVKRVATSQEVDLCGGWCSARSKHPPNDRTVKGRALSNGMRG